MGNANHSLQDWMAANGYQAAPVERTTDVWKGWQFFTTQITSTQSAGEITPAYAGGENADWMDNDIAGQIVAMGLWVLPPADVTDITSWDDANVMWQTISQLEFYIESSKAKEYEPCLPHTQVLGAGFSTALNTTIHGSSIATGNTENMVWLPAQSPGQTWPYDGAGQGSKIRLNLHTDAPTLNASISLLLGIKGGFVKNSANETPVFDMGGLGKCGENRAEITKRATGGRLGNKTLTLLQQ